MQQLGNWENSALTKLADECKSVTGQKEKAMTPAVLKTLKTFCQQDPEFAKAVVQGGSFKDCMQAVAKGVGSCISDLDAYKKAVQFYFPGAEIKMTMTIDLVGAADQEDASEDNNGLTHESRPMILDLDTFF